MFNVQLQYPGVDPGRRLHFRRPLPDQPCRCRSPRGHAGCQGASQRVPIGPAFPRAGSSRARGRATHSRRRCRGPLRRVRAGRLISRRRLPSCSPSPVCQTPGTGCTPSYVRGVRVSGVGRSWCRHVRQVHPRRTMRCCVPSP